MRCVPFGEQQAKIVKKTKTQNKKTNHSLGTRKDEPFSRCQVLTSMQWKQQNQGVSITEKKEGMH